MRDWQSQAHVKHYCKYHVVFVPKYRKKSIYGTLRKDIGGILRELCRQQGVDLVEGYAMKDHIHMLLMIPPKFSVANTLFDGIMLESEGLLIMIFQYISRHS